MMSKDIKNILFRLHANIAVNNENENESTVKCLINLGAQLNNNNTATDVYLNDGYKKVPLIVALHVIEEINLW